MDSIIEQLVFVTALHLNEGKQLFPVVLEIGMADQTEVERVVRETLDDCGYDYNAIQFDKGFAHRGTKCSVIGIARQGAVLEGFELVMAEMYLNAKGLHEPESPAEELPPAELPLLQAA